MEDKRLAILIDADNVSPKCIQFILEEAVNHGIPTYKRIYGDWTQPNLGQWKEVLLQYSITPMQQYSYTTGKNSTDSALIIDAMDILYSQNVDGFCIVSSDSDFTKLAARLRESGMYVVGMGEKKTPKPFISACERFKYLEQTPIKDTTDLKELVEPIKNIIRERSDENGWAFLGEVGGMLNKRFPDFDSRNYGYDKLSSLVKALKEFEVESRKTSDSKVILPYIKSKK